MQRGGAMKMFMMILLLALLSSCVTGGPRKRTPEISCDIKMYQTEDGNFNGRCLCRCLDLNKPESPLIDITNCDSRYQGRDVRLGLMSCNKLVGFKFKSYLEDIRPWILETKSYCEDTIGSSLYE
jgi:hypothetical protein